MRPDRPARYHANQSFVTMIRIEQDGGVFNYRVAGIAVRDGAVLLHRAEHEAFWVLPGGRCEMGEDGAAALRREMVEETGAEPQVGPLTWVVENFFEYEGCSSHELGLYFSMAFPEGSSIYERGTTFDTMDGDVNLTYRWIPLSELGSIAVKPSFIAARLVALSDIVEHIVHLDAE
jgi:8-oxo-dGTP pyrophosphatase MutT (NUDIX family)